MTLGDSIRTVYAKYFTFSGRASRSEFWWYQLFYLIIVSIPLSIVSQTLDDIWTLINFIPSLAVSWRRLHDTDRSGLWNLLPAVGLPLMLLGFWFGGIEAFMSPFVLIGGFMMVACVILLIVWYAMAGTPGPNRFGNDPLNPTDADVFE